MTTPNIQYFASSGTWVKPAGAVRVDVTLRGGDGGTATATDGGDGGGATFIDLERVPAAWAGAETTARAPQEGSRGILGVMSFDAASLPEAVLVTVGKGGRPGGRDGYALIVTHLDGEAEGDLSPMVARPRARAAESAADAALAIRTGDIREARNLLREAEHELDLAERRAGEAAAR